MDLKKRSHDMRIYVMPTLYGWLFIGMGAIFFFISIYRNNNITYMLAFLFISTLFVAMIQTHNNLLGISLRSIHIPPQFAGNAISVMVTILNESSHTNSALTITTSQKREKNLFGKINALEAHTSGTVNCFLSVSQRGVHTLHTVCINSLHPVGLFRAWKRVRVDTPYYVYPSPQGELLPPLESRPSLQQGEGGGGSGRSDFSGHRQYLTGESQNHIDWKVVARGRPIMVKEFHEGQPDYLVFDWHAIRKGDEESRLSQISQWIKSALQNDLKFEMRLPNQHVPFGHGKVHGAKCLKILAGYGGE